MKREHWLVVFLSAAVALPCRATQSPVPAYGDDDLARLHERRGETGVLSVVATKPDPPPRGRAEDAHGESYWRGEAAKLAVQLRPLTKQAEALRSRIASAVRPVPKRPALNGRSRSAPLAPPPARDTRLFEDQLRAVEREIEARQLELEERARRERALPGWIR